MTSIVELFPKARKLTFDLQTLLQYVEKGHASPDDAGMNLDELGRQLDVLESLVGQERPAQREDWRRCVMKTLIRVNKLLVQYNNSNQYKSSIVQY